MDVSKAMMVSPVQLSRPEVCFAGGGLFVRSFPLCLPRTPPLLGSFFCSPREGEGAGVEPLEEDRAPRVLPGVADRDILLPNLVIAPHYWTLASSCVCFWVFPLFSRYLCKANRSTPNRPPTP